MIEVAGESNKALDKLHKAIDKGSRYKALCHEFANDYGFKADEVYRCWVELAAMREFECRWPRGVAGWQAMRDVRRFFYYPGEEGN